VELRFQVDDEFVNNIKARAGYRNVTELARDALTLLEWATTECAHGRYVLSGGMGGGNLVRLAMPKLEELRNKSQVEMDKAKKG
jgi:hypothetical protein